MAALTVTGVADLKRWAAAFPGLTVEAGKIALYREAQGLLAASKQEVPVDLGTLRSSGTVEGPDVTGRTITIAVGYGGAASAYALAIHENPRAGRTGGVSPQGRRYKHWATTGGWKYLERPALQRAGGMAGRLAATLRPLLERKG